VNAARLAERARIFSEHDISAGLTAQVSSVVRLVGVDKVALLASTIFTNPAAGAVMHAYLRERVESGHSADAIARELGLVSDLQRFSTRPFSTGGAA
jgi:hypothetical protein